MPGWTSGFRVSGSSSVPASENFWQAGPTGPCGPCSELYLDRGLEFGRPDDLPGGENERFLEYWNLVFMQFDQNPINTLTPLPAQNIDTGLGLNRMATILQDKPSIFETDQFAPLVELGEELSGRRYGEGGPVDRALRVLADHSRAMAFLIADGVVPSNEDRGYVLRRIMRRAIQQGRALELGPHFLERYAARVRELMGGEYPELEDRREDIDRWLRAEEEGFSPDARAGDAAARASYWSARSRRARRASPRDDAFMLHDTYGFPIEMTRELAAERGLGVDEEGFEALMNQQRERARASSGRTREGERLREQAVALATQAGFQTDFVGYRTTEQDTTIAAVQSDDGRVLVKLVESPFYPTGGGQIADTGYVECSDGDCRARVEDVLRIGEDQVVALVPERGESDQGGRARPRAGRPGGPPRHRVQPHGDPPPARCAPHPPGHSRAPGRLLRGAGQAPLRLHPRSGAIRGRAPRRRGDGQLLDPGRPPRPRAHHHARGGPASGRDGPVRREVRRRRSDGRGGGRFVLSRAVRRHARAPHG